MDGRGSGERLVVDPHDGRTLYFGSNQDGLWRSTDAGATFSKINGDIKTISLVAAEPYIPGMIYVGSADNRPGLFVSKDGGATLTRIDATPSQVPQHVAFAADGTFFVAFASGKTPALVNPSNADVGSVWKRDVSGRWSEITPVRPDGGNAFGYSGIDVGPDGTLAVSTLDRWGPGDDIFVSKDAGAHWSALSGRSKHDATPYPWLVSYTKGQDRMGHWIADLKINPFNADELIYGTGYGLWMSRNLGAAGNDQTVLFDFNVRNFEEAATTQLVSPLGDATLLATFLDVAGGAWDDVSKGPNTGLFQPPTESNYSVDYAGLKPSYIVRRTSSENAAAYISDTSGADWEPMNPESEPFAIAKDAWRRESAIAVSANATSLVWGAENTSGYYSTDNGKTWKLSTGWPQGSDRPLKVLSDKAIDRVFYVYDRAGRAIDVSVDGGASFRPAITGLPTLDSWQPGDLYVVPGRVRDLWLVAPFGLLHSAKVGESMAPVATVDTAWKLGFGAPAQTDGYPAIYLWGKVRGEEGLWRSDDEARTWTRINDDVHQFGHIDAVAGDPLEYGTVYVAPGGRGVLVGKPIQ